MIRECSKRQKEEQNLRNAAEVLQKSRSSANESSISFQLRDLFGSEDSSRSDVVIDNAFNQKQKSVVLLKENATKVLLKRSMSSLFKQK